MLIEAKAKEFFQALGGFTASGMEIEWKLFVNSEGVKAVYAKNEIASWLGFDVE